MGTYCMRKSSVLQWTLMVLVAVALATPTAVAGEMTFKSIVVFGDSLSDPGNDFALINTQNTPPYDNLDPVTIIPHAPYAKGGHHYSNGATWVEQFARPRRLAQYVNPAWQSAGTKAANYAVGGGRARDDKKNKNLKQQVERFLEDVGNQAPSDALYVIEFGGNDIRDALVEYSKDNRPGGDAIISEALTQIGANIEILHGAGARKFLVWNVPDLGKTPAVIAMHDDAQALISRLVSSFNWFLSMSLPTEIKLFDAFVNVNKIVDIPGDYGLEVVNASCVTPNSPPFDCREPDDYLFWDGIHPTKAAHGIIAQMVADVLVQ